MRSRRGSRQGGISECGPGLRCVEDGHAFEVPGILRIEQTEELLVSVQDPFLGHGAISWPGMDHRRQQRHSAHLIPESDCQMRGQNTSE